MSAIATGVVSESSIAVGMALGTGGFAQILAGMWEFPAGDAFRATVFTLYGSFWLSYSAILLPLTGIVASYPTEKELHTALGFFFTVWLLITLLFTFASLRKPLSFIVLFGFLSSTYAFLAAGEFTLIQGLTKVGGALGIVTGLIALFLAVKPLVAEDQPPALPI